MKPSVCLGLALVFILLLAPSASTYAVPTATGWSLIGWNNLGMHCMDADYSVWSILPPYNTIHAQLIDPAGILVTNPAALGITVTYQGVIDPANSINTTSFGKTNFWKYVQPLYGPPLAFDVGLAGNSMPGLANTPRPMSFDPSKSWFIAEGIPITPIDDAHVKNAYPLMHLVARDSIGGVLATTDIVLPVSDEMDCRACHSSGSAPAGRPSVGWMWDQDGQRDYRLNILLLHDDRQRANPLYGPTLAAAGFASTGLYATVSSFGTPILCAKCHLSEALPGTGQAGVNPLTAAMHAGHATVVDPTNGLTLDSSNNRSACYRCHPGSTTKCLRGAMGSAVAGDGSLAMQCQSCHGSMSVVGSSTRTGWLQEPTCQSCHTGTATNNSGQIRYTSVFDAPGHQRVAANATFATNADAPAPGLSLFRFSFGHGRLACESCHGSTHAEFPSSHTNDNLQSLNAQGHSGMLVECAACHVVPPTTASQGPHGMHPVGQDWVDTHPDQTSNTAACRPCHGTDYRGTMLSRSQADRTLFSEFGTKRFWNGFTVGCYNCHQGPTSENANPNRAPVANSTSASTTAGSSVSVNLTATDADNNPLTFRLVSQPSHGTTALATSVAVYFPDPDYVGADSFTFAASDGATESNLATVSLAVSFSSCSLSCTGSVPANSLLGESVAFLGTGTGSGCGASESYEWDFGDGSSRVTVRNPTHAYLFPDSYRWTLTVRAGVATCTATGTIRTLTSPLRVPLLLQPLRASTANQGGNIDLAWDANNCPSVGYHILYGYGTGIRAGAVAGGVCGIGASGSYLWTSTPDPRTDPTRLLWFLLVGNDGFTTEGSWGLTSAGAERGGAAPSHVCTMTRKEINGTCTTP